MIKGFSARKGGVRAKVISPLGVLHYRPGVFNESLGAKIIFNIFQVDLCSGGKAVLIEAKGKMLIFLKAQHCDKEIAKLKAELKKARRSRLKGRPSSRVERSSVKSMRFQARDELLAASLSAMETMSLASGSPSKRRTSTSSKGTPSPLTMRSASRSSRRGSYE